MAWLYQVFRFFASLRCAVILIVVIASIVAVGTLIESYHGTDAAQILIYRTSWFSLVLILLAFNLLASALDRLPWKKKHVGFVTTHLGIILILIGSFISQRFGIEGQLAIQENTSAGRMTLQNPSQPLIQLAAADGSKQLKYRIKPHALPWSGRQVLIADEENDLKVILLADYMKALLEESIQPSAEGRPALHVKIEGSFAQNEQWLVLGDPEREKMVLGPATIQFANEPFSVEAEKLEASGRIKFSALNGQVIYLPVHTQNVGEKITLPQTPYVVFIERALPHAVVEGKTLINQSDAWLNPAVELILEGNGMKEKHTVFAKFPDFPTVHGMKPSDSGFRLTYEVPGFEQDAAKNELRFIFRPSVLPRYQIKKGSEVVEGNLILNEEVPTRWMDLTFTVDAYHEKAVLTRQYSPLPNTSERVGALPVLKARIGDDGETLDLWLPQGTVQEFVLGGKKWYALYGLETQPLGFKLFLEDFIIETDPGTERPASFKSEVILQDVTKSIEKRTTIQMNEPLIHRGYKVYQSAYQLVPDEPDISIFTVARDPGNPLKYVGAIIMLTGILMLFYIKQFSTLKSSDPMLRQRT